MIAKIKNVIALFEALSSALDTQNWQEIGRCEGELRLALNELLKYAEGKKW